MAPEQVVDELLLAAARTQVDTSQSLRVRSLCVLVADWPALTEQAAEHGVAGLLYATLQREASGCVPEAVLRALGEHASNDAAFSLLQLAALRDVLEWLHAGGVREVAPFKGPILAAEAYGNAALRRSVDLDLLIHERDRAAARRALEARGYTLDTPVDPASGRPTEPGKYEYHFEKPGHVAVELRWRITQQQFHASLDLDYLLPRCATRSIAGFDYLSIAPEDLLVILCAHGAKHSWCRIVWLCDIAELVRSHPYLNWTVLLRRASRLGLGRVVRFSLILASNLLDAAIPAEVLEHARRDETALRLAEMREEDGGQYHLLLLESGRRWIAEQEWRWRQYVVKPARALLALQH